MRQEAAPEVIYLQPCMKGLSKHKQSLDVVQRPWIISVAPGSGKHLRRWAEDEREGSRGTRRQQGLSGDELCSRVEELRGKDLVPQ